MSTSVLSNATLSTGADISLSAGAAFAVDAKSSVNMHAETTTRLSGLSTSMTASEDALLSSESGSVSVSSNGGIASVSATEAVNIESTKSAGTTGSVKVASGDSANDDAGDVSIIGGSSTGLNEGAKGGSISIKPEVGAINGSVFVNGANLNLESTTSTVLNAKEEASMSGETVSVQSEHKLTLASISGDASITAGDTTIQIHTVATFL